MKIRLFYGGASLDDSQSIQKFISDMTCLCFSFLPSKIQFGQGGRTDTGQAQIPKSVWKMPFLHLDMHRTI